MATRSPKGALQPWRDADSLYSDAMRRALSYAILAPNPHNRQPWVVSLESETEAMLHYDPERLLPVTDPFHRQIVIGLGCFLELFSMAATAFGYRSDIRYFPLGAPGAVLDGRPIAHLSLHKEPDVVSHRLFVQALLRHTNRNPYDTSRSIDNEILQRLGGAATDGVWVGVVGDGGRLTALRTLTRDAMRKEIATPEAYGESIDLMRIGRSEIEANPDGIALSGALLETLSLVGILTRNKLSDPTSSAYQIGLDMMDEAAMSSMGFVWITTMGNDRITQIKAGRAFMRLALQATADGLALQPMSQALQEYSAMAPFFATVHDLLIDRPGMRVQMLARLGNAADIDPAPRWPLKSRVKDA